MAVKGQMLVSWNVNGIRASMKGGLLDFLTAETPDIVALQEVKADVGILKAIAFEGYATYWHPAEKAGYSGTAFLVRQGLAVERVQTGIGVADYDREGRVLTLETPDYVLVNLYAPHSQRELARLDYKLAFSAAVDTFVATLEKTTGKPVIITGDLNVAHQPIDLANPKANVKNAGFLPVERAWLDGWQARGYRDAFRQFCDEPGHYTWWSQRVGVREKNVGWRIDAFWVAARLMDGVMGCSHRPLQRGSDHCPVVLELAL